jgi:hypothetical protein
MPQMDLPVLSILDPGIFVFCENLELVQTSTTAGVPSVLVAPDPGLF